MKEELTAGMEPTPHTTFQDSFSEEVWKSTYKYHEDETIDDTLKRVAKAIASVEETKKKQEEWTNKFYEMLSGFKVVPGGRILANAGTEYKGTTLINCFLPGMQVLTMEGYKSIENIEIGEFVLTHKGRWRKVMNVLNRHYDGEISEISNNYFRNPILTTPNHNFYQGKNEWKEISECENVMLFYQKENNEENNVLDLKEYFTNEINENVINYDELKIWTTTINTFGKWKQSSYLLEGASINRFIPFDENFAYFIGRFIGDGSSFKQNKSTNFIFEKHGFNIVFNNNEEDSLQQLKEYIESVFDISVNVNRNKGGNFSYLRKHSPIISSFLHRFVGDKGKTKFIPPAFFTAPSNIKFAFLRGIFDSDGMVNKTGSMSIVLANEKLIMDVQSILLSIGIPSTKTNFVQSKSNPFNCSQSYQLYIGKTFGYDLKISLSKYYNDDRITNTPLKQNATTGPKKTKEGFFIDVKPQQTYYNGYVYNLSVDEDNSYVVNNVIVKNCYVSPRKRKDIDSIDGIIDDVKNQCKTLKSEGGWGTNFSFLRPRGAFIHGIGVESPGAVKYMEIYDKTSDIITSGSGTKSSNRKAKGKIRKGAMMSIIDCSHPDVEEFIRAKQTPGRLTKFNLSVNLSNKFMWKLLRIKEIDELLTIEENDSIRGKLKEEKEEQDKWYLQFPETTDEHYAEEWDGDIKEWEEKGYKVRHYKTISVTGLWNMIMESTYLRAEPGVLFLDRSNYFNPLNYAEKIQATNPCSEQTLAESGVCCLSSCNLTQFITDDRKFDLEKIRKYIRYIVRFLDNVNTYSNAPLPEYKDSMMKKRRIGIGVMGWGSALYMMKIKFGSDEASEVRKELMNAIASESYMASIDLAEEKGMFEFCDPQKHSKGAFIQSLGLENEYVDKLLKTGIRNSSLLSVQPNGNSSIFANVVSGGIEPVFMPEYTRTVIVNEMPDEIAKITPKWYEGEWHETKLFKFEKEGDEEILKGKYKGTTYKIDKNRGLTKEVLCQDYGVRWLAERGQWEPNADWAVTTTNLDVKYHVEDLKGFAKWVDSAISKTVNVPYEYPFEDFKDIYLNAYSSGYIKGMTTYRAGTMTSVLSAKEEKDADPADEEIILDDVEVPVQAPAVVSTIRAEGKKWYLTTIMDEEQKRPIAFFCHTNHAEKGNPTHEAVEKLLNLAETKGIPSKWIEGTVDKIKHDNNVSKIARCISLNLRHGVLIRNVVGALDDVEDVFVGSFLFQIRKHLTKWIKDGEPVTNGNGGSKCGECGGEMRYESGCSVCSSCGISACS